MVDYRPEEFKIGYGRESDRDSTETAIREEMAEQRVEKLGHRITLISILLPVLILVIFAGAYLDIKKRVYGMQSSGVEEVARLSEELESKFSKLSVQFAALDSELAKREESLKKLEDSFTRKIASMDEIFLSMETTTNTLKGANQELLENNQALEKKIGELEAKLAGVDEKLSGVDEKLSGADKKISDAAAENAAAVEAVRQNTLDKQELSSQFAVIDESFKVVQGDLQTLSSNMDLIEKNLKGELEGLAKVVLGEKDRLDQSMLATEELTKVVAEFRKEFNSFSLDTKNLVEDSDLTLQVERARLKLKVDVDEAVREMKARMDRLEKKIDAASGRASSPPVKPGQVIEQNLQ